MRWDELPGMTLGMRWEELPGMRWEELAGVRCTKFLVPGVPMLTFGDRCTKFLVPGVPMFSRGARCTTFFPEPVEAKGFGNAITLRVFLGFVAPIVV
jgi:hypothetical protein